MSAQLGINSGLTSYQPTIQLQMPTIGTIPGSIPKVKNTEEALRYPGRSNSEDVLFDENDSEIAYFRSIDSAGMVRIDRRRCIPEPEPTLEDKYVTKEDFNNLTNTINNFMEEFRNVRKHAIDEPVAITVTESPEEHQYRRVKTAVSVD